MRRTTSKYDTEGVVFHSERSLIEEYVYFGQVQLYSYTLCPDLIVA